MIRKHIAEQYIAFLQSGDISSVLSMFAVNAVVHSPLYGSQPAASFYQHLFEDTNQSELRTLGVFEDPDSHHLALYFNYKWTLADDSFVNFDVVDILEINEENKITSLKIIYDTVNSRKILERMKE